MSQVKITLPRRAPSEPAYAALRLLLADARKTSGMTQNDLAKMVGRPQSFIAKLERGERYLDAIEFFVLAKILELDLVAIIRSLEAQILQQHE